MKFNMFIKRHIVVALLIMLTLSSGCGSKSEGKKIDTDSLKAAENHKVFKAFKEMYPTYEPITCKVGDVNNDGKEDLIIIYRNGKLVRMRVILDGENVTVTDEVAAPIENQNIELKNIDDKDEMEFIVSGSKRGNVGYAIYRIVDNNIKDLFGQDMDQCC